MLTGRYSNLPTAHRAHPAALRERVPSALPGAPAAARPPGRRETTGGAAANVVLSSTHVGTVESSR